MLSNLIRRWRALFPRAADAPAARVGACRPSAWLEQGLKRPAPGALLQAMEPVPEDPRAWVAQADGHLARDEREDAWDCYEIALAHAADCAPARLGMARMLREAGDVAAAREQIGHALQIAPHDAAAHFESALIHRRAGDTQGAVASYERALQINPDFFAASVNLGLLYLSERGEPHHAQRYFERAIELDPSSVAAQANLGLALDEQGRVNEAMAHYDKLIAARPDESEFRWNRGLALLGSGDYARGWDDYEARNARTIGAAPRIFPFPAWQGGALRPGATLLVYGEQGLGDEVMFASCVPDLLARGMDLVLECDSRLAKLFARSFAVARVHGAARDGDRSWLAKFPRIEEQIAIGSLPRLLRRTAADFPRHNGYLRGDPARVAHWRAKLACEGAGHKVGIAWRGGSAGTRRDLRSISPHELVPLLAMPGVVFINLQRDAGAELEEMRATRGAKLLDFAGALNDIDETAALLQALDGVITVDNTIAHLAGALGCKSRVILSHSADWRWLRGQSASPWYPTVKLCRQTLPGDWASALKLAGSDFSENPAT